MLRREAGGCAGDHNCEFRALLPQAAPMATRPLPV
jgi:hypothetical protein